VIWFYCLGVQLLNGGGPDAKDESDLVDQIRNVVDDVQQTGIDGTSKETEEISKRVDGPTNGDDGSHGVEGGLDGLGGVSDGLELAGFTVEDFLQDESPSAHAEDESNPGVDGTRFAEVTGEKHENGSNQKSPEDAGGSRANGAEDEVELDHLQRHSNCPINVSVDDRRGEVGYPEFSHVEVMNRGDEGDEGTDSQRCSPVAWEALSFKNEEKCWRNHSNGDDPERDTDGIVSANPLWFEFMVHETGGAADVIYTDTRDTGWDFNSALRVKLLRKSVHD